MHPKFKVGDEVTFHTQTLTGDGEIIGIATEYIISTYIVLLDKPLSVPNHEKPWKGIVLPGTEIKLKP